MSTDYILRRPLENSEHGPVLHGDGGYVHPDIDERGRVVAFTDPSTLVDLLDPVSEHDDTDPDYERLWRPE